MPPPLYNIPSHARSLLVFGGTFDPPHLGHIQLPELARQQLDLDWLLYVPAAAPPLKKGPVATEQQRLDMLALAISRSEHASISTIEFNRGGTSYTHDTLLTLHEHYPDLSMRLLIGADQALQFHKWHNAQQIIQLAEPAVMLRDSIDTPVALLNALAVHWTPEEHDAWKHRLVSLPSIDCNSTQLREWLANPDQHKDALSNRMSPDVLEYIRTNNPYT
ncbi:MAG: nicotinate (nicotinamide) nucleotide adenylyltransferase [Planctomycetota bacterium]|jgi:nicotinate-nucleotide adenylyltransferase